jgi:hypothetical protein
MAGADSATERRYDIAGAALSPQLGGFVGECLNAPTTRQYQHADHFDTRDLKLLRAGVSLHRREGGPDEGWQLRLPDTGGSLREVHLPLTGQAGGPPSELVSLVRPYCGDDPLVPVARLDTVRQRWYLHDTSGRQLAELVRREVRARTVGEHTRSRSWREIGVELAEHGQTELLNRIEWELLKAGARPTDHTSELHRLLTEHPD